MNIPFFNNSNPGTGQAYGILPPCWRCNYAKSHEPVLIISRDRGIRMIVNLDGNTYVRKGNCIGQLKCDKCFIKAQFPETYADLPCKWEKLKRD